MLKAITHYFYPEGKLEIEEQRKSILLINVVLVLSLFSLTYLFICFFTAVYIGVYTNLIMFPLTMLALWVFKRTGSFNLATNLAAFGLTAGICEGVLFSGNVRSPAILWLMVAPTMAFVLGNKRSGIVWSILISILFILFGFITIAQFDIPYLFPAFLQNYYLTFTLLAITVWISLVIVIYENTKNRAFSLLNIKTEQVIAEKKKADDLLLNILPGEVAHELKEFGFSEARQYENVTVLFADFVNFTGVSEHLTPKELVAEIDYCFRAFDEIVGRNGLEKIKTIGDAYLAVCGLPQANSSHAMRTTDAAREMLTFIQQRKAGNGLFEIRIGLHSGSVVAGIVGTKKFAYDIWGDHCQYCQSYGKQ
ncbi:MAG TPA: adenylate/guanylate cyclase domain-containing protein [Candidatus Kapabacteria bacterium]|jgi:class 3 adenylate cyclase